MAKRSAGDRWGSEDSRPASVPAHSEHEDEGPNAAASGESRDKLRSYIERVNRLEEEKATISEDIREVCAEAKAMGYDPKVIRRLAKEARETDAQRVTRENFEALLDTYRVALGPLAETPLGRAGTPRE